MIQRLRVPLASAVALVPILASCVSTQLPPIAGTGFRPLDDELRLWDDARGEEQRMLEQAPIYDDPELVEYLNGIVDRLTPPSLAAAERQINFRVRVIEDPTLNAFAFPHGSIYVHTGLLARMENEAQLATVLAHEMTHVQNRHTLRVHRTARNRELGFGLAALTAAIILDEMEDDAIRDGDPDKYFLTGVMGDIFLGLGLQLALQASVNGYGRDLEREADFGSFAKLERARYDLRESPKLYDLLQEGHGETGDLERFFFGSHPKLERRARAAREHLADNPQAAAEADAAEQSAPVFAERMQPVLRDDARNNIELGRYKLARRELQHALAQVPHDWAAHLLVARLKLARAQEEGQGLAPRATLRREAGESLRKAVRRAPDEPEARLELGLFAYENEERAIACSELERYVELVGEPRAERDVGDLLGAADWAEGCPLKEEPKEEPAE